MQIRRLSEMTEGENLKALQKIETNFYQKPKADFDEYGLRYSMEHLNSVVFTIGLFPLEYMADYVDVVTKTNVDNDNNDFISNFLDGVNRDINFERLNAAAIGNTAYVALNSKNEQAKQHALTFLDKYNDYTAVRLVNLTREALKQADDAILADKLHEAENILNNTDVGKQILKNADGIKPKQKTFDIALRYLKDIDFTKYPIVFADSDWRNKECSKEEKLIDEQVKYNFFVFNADKENNESNDNYRGMVFMTTVYHLIFKAHGWTSFFDVALEIIDANKSVLNTDFEKWLGTVYPKIMMDEWIKYCEELKKKTFILEGEIREDLFFCAYNYAID